MLCDRLAATESALLAQIVEALNDPDDLSAFDALEAWAAAAAVPLEAPWPEGCVRSTQERVSEVHRRPMGQPQRP